MASPFLDRHSIVRTIWGDPDSILLIFAGAAAEFALNRAVDWLFFTNALPNDPIGRLFSTVSYAQRIVFASESDAQATMSSISAIHEDVERARGRRIPEWAHRDVLYLLIDYSQRAHGLLHGRLTRVQQEELYAGFLRLGAGLGVQQLPATFRDWEHDRRAHLERNLQYSDFTRRLFEQYRLHLGPWRYRLLLEMQAMLAPPRVRELLELEPKRVLFGPTLQVYGILAGLGLRTPMQRALVPPRYWRELATLMPERA